MNTDEKLIQLMNDMADIVNQMSCVHQAQHTALVNALIERGLITQIDINRTLKELMEAAKLEGDLVNTILNSFLEEPQAEVSPESALSRFRVILGGKDSQSKPDGETDQE